MGGHRKRFDPETQGIVSLVVEQKKLLSTQLEAANNSITSVATTVQRNISQLSTQLEAANNSIRSVATTVQRNIPSCLPSLKQPTIA